ncbi:MAG: ACT domain-containing protein [Chitinivibrionales bacterium]|nr:ACT domain-containing protein [Chitinivibrionales bacterium]
MKLTQISVFLENRKGRLSEVCTIMGEESINIVALTIAETDAFGVLRMVVDQPDKALKILRGKKFVAASTEIVGIEVPNQPGGLAQILKLIDKNNINIEYMYGFIENRGDKALMVFRFEKTDAAITFLNQQNIPILTQI